MEDLEENSEEVHWEPVAKEEELSPTMKKILEYHQNYIKFWKIKNGIDR